MGAPLGGEMWSLMYNELPKKTELHELLLQQKTDFIDYESIYYKVINKLAPLDNLSDSDIESYSDALKDVYKTMNSIVRRPTIKQHHKYNK